MKLFFLVVFYSCCVTPGFIGSFESFCNFDNVLLHCVEYQVETERQRETNCLENHKDRFRDGPDHYNNLHTGHTCD